MQMPTEHHQVSFWFHYSKCRTPERDPQDFENSAEITQGASKFGPQVKHSLHRKTQQDYLEAVGAMFGLACIVLKTSTLRMLDCKCDVVTLLQFTAVFTAYIVMTCHK